MFEIVSNTDANANFLNLHIEATKTSGDKQLYLPLFLLIRNFGKHNTCRNVSKMSVTCVLLTDQIEIQQSKPNSMT